jgi:hypothetical protein
MVLIVTDLERKTWMPACAGMTGVLSFGGSSLKSLFGSFSPEKELLD